MDLKSLVLKHGSDKVLSGYVPIYERILTPFSGKISVLEVGVGTLYGDRPSNMCFMDQYRQGASLRAWADYFPEAAIYGIDVCDDCLIDENRIKTFIVDSRDEAACDSLLGSLEFDIIIDDGLHELSAQVDTYKALYKRLKAQGLYVVEDITSAYFLDSFPGFTRIGNFAYKYKNH